MMRKIVNWRLVLTLFVVAILILCQFIPEKSIAGIDCNRSLVDPNAPYQLGDVNTYYGFPLIVVQTYTEGCPGNHNTSIAGFYMEGLLGDILFVVVIGTSPYWFFSLWSRFRRRNNVE
jgi:hypothetical protein